MDIKKTLTAFAIMACMLPLAGYGGMSDDLDECSIRPMSEFLGAQGSTAYFFPPVADMLAWTDAALEYFALVDYAGLADSYIESETGSSLGTRMQGSVLECAAGDGRAKISVVLNTSKALGFAQSVADLFANEFDFLGTPTVFGVKAQDVVENGDAPALGSAKFHATFYIAAPGAALPDLRIAFQENMPDVRPITIDFRATLIGRLPDGTKARLRVQQVGATDATTGDLVFSREIVDLNK